MAMRTRWRDEGGDFTGTDDAKWICKLLAIIRVTRIIAAMYTIVETLTFQKQAADVWGEDELADFVDCLAMNPMAGDVVQGTQGARKIRWAAKGKGKRGGARVIYFNRLESGFILLLLVYVKNELENISTKTIQELKNE
jgi:hypothetical protein